MTAASPPIRGIRPVPLPLLPRGAAGVDIDRALRQGTLVRVTRGVCAPSDLWRALNARDRYLATVHAVALTHPGAVFCLESAAALLGLPLLGRQREVHILDAQGTAARRIGTVRVHVSAVARDIDDLDGILVTTPSETVVDLARLRHPASALAAADALVQASRWVDGSPLLERNDARAGSRGRRAAVWPLKFASPLSGSVLESVNRACVHWLGYPPPVLQAPFSLPSGGCRADMFWEEFGVVGEADGRVKYDGSLGDPAAALWKEKRREDELRRRVRTVVRWTWADLRSRDVFDRRLHEAGIPRLRQVESARLATLVRLL